MPEEGAYNRRVRAVRRATLCGIAAAGVALGCTHSTLDLTTGGGGPGAFGDAHDGTLSLAAGETRTINDCFPLTGATSTSVTLETGGATLAPGTRLLLMQVQDGVATSGDQTPLTQASQLGDAGRWQLADVTAAATSAGALVVELAPPPAFSFSFGDGRRAQACTVPEYDTVVVPSSAAIRAPPWDGGAGGVLAFFASSGAQIAGRLEASGLGFRGGELRANSGNHTVPDLDTTGGDGGGKGEGIDGRSWSRSGRGNYANGGGGGNAHNAGGGGGGLGGAGGRGGNQIEGSPTTPPTFGMSGVAISVVPGERIVFGGGGGAGEQNDGVGGVGGAGGGAIVVFTAALTGDGTIAADGAPGSDCGAAPTTDYPDGAGGGGAGGLVWITAGASTFGGVLSAKGGPGGSTLYLGNDLAVGPGGGGGGGIVETDGFTVSAPILTAGTAGVYTGMTITTANGAAPGSPGLLLP